MGWKLGSLALSSNRSAPPGPCGGGDDGDDVVLRLKPGAPRHTMPGPNNFLKTQIVYRLSQLFRKPLTGDILPNCLREASRGTMSSAAVCLTD